MWVLVVAFVALCLGAASGSAFDLSLHDTPTMARVCRTAVAIQDASESWGTHSKEQQLAWINCHAYMAGFSAGYGDHREVAFDGIPMRTFCIRFPVDASAARTAAVFVGWADRNPSHLWHLKLNVAVMTALSEAWPCQN